MKDKKDKSFNRQAKVELNQPKKEDQNTIPIHNYWFFGIMVIIGSSMFRKSGTVDLQLHDTYFVIYFHYIAITVSLLLMFYGFIYWSQRNKSLTKWMTQFHSLLTMVVLGTFYMTCFQEDTWNVGPVIQIGALLFLVAQVILTLNIWKVK